MKNKICQLVLILSLIVNAYLVFCYVVLVDQKQVLIEDSYKKNEMINHTLETLTATADIVHSNLDVIEKDSLFDIMLLESDTMVLLYEEYFDSINTHNNGF